MRNNISLYQAGAEDLETSWGEVVITEAVAILVEVSSVPVKCASGPNHIFGRTSDCGVLLCKLIFECIASLVKNVKCFLNVFSSFVFVL